MPGRLDRRGKWLFDVAHNPTASGRWCSAIDALRPPRPLHALVSILGDKEWPEMLVQLDRVIDRGRAHRGAHGREPRLERRVAPPLAPRPRPAAGARRVDAGARVPRGARTVQEGAGTVLVTGSFHTVGDVMTALGMEVV